MRNLDAHITSSRYSRAFGLVTCPDCRIGTNVVAETEYGGTTWEPGECRVCGREFSGDEKWLDDEPDEEPDIYCNPSGQSR